MADIIGTEGDDELADSGWDADTIIGLGGNDIITARAGHSADGGAGWDRLRLELYMSNSGVTLDLSGLSGNEPVTIYGGQFTGFEYVEALFLSSYPDYVVAPQFLPDEDFRSGGSLTDFYMYGAGGNDVLVGTPGADDIDGGGGNDIIVGGAPIAEGWDTWGFYTYGDWLSGEEGDDVIYGGAGYDNVDGGLGNDVLYGGDGGDRLFGHTGTDVLVGGAGNDDFFGDEGADVMIGGAGSDGYAVDNAGDVIVEDEDADSFLNFDYVIAEVSYTLGAGVYVEELLAGPAGAINLTGNEFDQYIFGASGANVLDGRGGADTLAGRGGDDWYFVDNARDVVEEKAGEGTNDRIFASASYTLGAGVQVETLTTTDNDAATAINLTGNELANLIYGNAGANVLDGKAGADMLVGFGGNDWYYIDNAADAVIEHAGWGANDRIFAGVSYTLGADVEVEMLTTSDNLASSAINLTGNALGNLIYGNAGTNVLDGKAGADTLVGLEGNDWYYVDNAADAVIEYAGWGTNDRVFASVSYKLGADVRVEMLTTSDNLASTAINLTGNELVNLVYGNAGANVLDGKGGADSLTGMAGADTFCFSSAIGTGNVDYVSDFTVADDTIQLDDAAFTGLALGALSAGAFNTGSTATQSDDRIIYDAATGALWFDADGLGGVGAVQFATLSTGLTLTSADFVVA